MIHGHALEIGGALLVALLNAALPLVLEFRALQRMSARTYGVLVTLEPAIGALVGALFLGQAIGLSMLGGHRLCHSRRLGRHLARPAGPPMSLAERQPLGRLLPLYVVVFMGFVGYSLMITVFTPMLLRGDRAMLPPGSSTSLRTIMLGVLLCLYPLGQLIGSPILGSLSDRFGRRPVLLISLTVTTACYVVISLAITANNLALLGFASLVAGFAEANIVTAQSAIADLVAPQQRNRYFGYIYMAVSLAYIVGPLGGGKLTDPHLLSWFSDATPFWAVVVLLASTTLVVLLCFRETKAPGGDEAQPRESLASLVKAFANPRLRRFYLVNFLLYLAIFGFFRSYPMYLVDEFRLDVSAMSEYVAWVGVPIVLANLWLTGFSRAGSPSGPSPSGRPPSPACS